MMKIAKIRPLFKKGVKLDIQNYKPISHLLVFFKILESVHRLLSFLKEVQYYSR